MLPVPRTRDDPPPRLAMALEWPRAAWTIVRLGLGGWASGLPAGDGRPVLVLPGLFNSDRSNFALRALLHKLGYRAYGWGLQRNFGVRTVGADNERLIARIEEIHAETGEKVTLIGVSLGGIMARLAAHRRPELVREVITISSPFAGPPTATNVWRPFELLTGERIGDAAVAARLEEAARPLPVPATAIWSRSDGLVNGLICREEEGSDARAIEIHSGHLFVQMKPETLRAVAKVLGNSSSPAKAGV
ncbi:esterase/lipase family protein [Sphingomonas sp.]|jgi:pimeloyl-ACP methyl ester carboxylesterase|uniref:esterase/lipase family protein n=1 Tax=Sphingomonas sp. TaxID=28214 RepID=UPI002EDA8E43